MFRILEKDPTKRPKSVTAAMDALVNAFRGAGVQVANQTPDAETVLHVTSVARLPRPGAASAAGPARAPKLAAAASLGSTSVPGWQGGTTSNAPPPRRPWIAAAVGALLLAGAAVGLGLRNGPAPATTGAPSAMPSAAGAGSAAPTAQAPAPPSAPATVSSAGTTSSAADVALAVSSVPPGTIVYLGETAIGTVPGEVRVPRGTGAIKLRFVAEGYSPLLLDVVPDADRTLTVNLTPKPARPGPVKKTPKDLEPF